jgi:UDP-N-acetylglucosamine transferase subunit ALG13
MTELVDTLQNYKRLLRDHQAELAKDLVNRHPLGNNPRDTVSNATEFRALQDAVNAVDELLCSLQVLI